jgi:signal transduction histidine kinase
MPDALLGDPLRLRQVLNNLVGNALKFTHQGGIEVRIAAVDQTAETLLLKVSVQDSGIGLTPEQGDHLFDALPAGGQLHHAPLRGHRAGTQYQ